MRLELIFLPELRDVIVLQRAAFCLRIDTVETGGIETKDKILILIGKVRIAVLG